MHDLPRKGDPRKASMKTHNTPLNTDTQSAGSARVCARVSGMPLGGREDRPT